MVESLEEETAGSEFEPHSARAVNVWIRFGSWASHRISVVGGGQGLDTMVIWRNGVVGEESKPPGVGDLRNGTTT